MGTDPAGTTASSAARRGRPSGTSAPLEAVAPPAIGRLRAPWSIANLRAPGGRPSRQGACPGTAHRATPTRGGQPTRLDFAHTDFHTFSHLCSRGMSLPGSGAEGSAGRRGSGRGRGLANYKLAASERDARHNFTGASREFKVPRKIGGAFRRPWLL
ncbi:hypothetical protein KM043_007346 [Ampulex compressa]|nr:hypothetical protein KM043_007346 [Ampulex compressa]